MFASGAVVVSEQVFVVFAILCKVFVVFVAVVMFCRIMKKTFRNL